MIRKPVLFRTDLMIHHAVAAVVYLSCIGHVSLQMSHVLIMECISSMNYIWRNNPSCLKWYRTLCIFCIRMPLSLWMWLDYNPTISYPFLQSTRAPNHYVYLSTLGNIYLFFIVYDMFILWRLYKPQTKQRLCKVSSY